MSRSRFDPVARHYDAGRPGYPDALYDAIEKFSRQLLNGAAVADVGAGTGIATRGLVDRGARVLAIDHGGQMLAMLRGRTPGASVVLADANELPIRSASLDLVTFAQSWHWVDLTRAPREVARVVRPGGAIAIWWNTADDGMEPWLDEHRARLQIAGQNAIGARFDAAWRSIPSAFRGFDVHTTHLAWERTVTREVILDEVRSKSYIEGLGTLAADSFVQRERALLPEGLLRQPFVTALAVVGLAA
jgi:SAM-dependent methyltransferase